MCKKKCLSGVARRKQQRKFQTQGSKKVSSNESWVDSVKKAEEKRVFRQKQKGIEKCFLCQQVSKENNTSKGRERKKTNTDTKTNSLHGASLGAYRDSVRDREKGILFRQMATHAISSLSLSALSSTA